jgi:tetratricopeptide (TPR) repeat protein
LRPIKNGIKRSDMNYLDDLPKRDKNHVTEDKATAAFQKRLLDSEAFILQIADCKDYGTDCQIEVVDQGRATNVRIHVQVKGTERPCNSDGSVSVEISRANLNYLLTQPYSFYVCYHVPTDSLRFRTADSVMRQYEHSGKNWTDQKTLTVTFTEDLTAERLISLAAVARSSAMTSRDWRAEQIAAQAAEVPKLLKRSVPDVCVPVDRQSACQLLEQLYKSGQDDVISAGFDKFVAVLGTDDDAIGHCYMAEINLAMAGRRESLERIESAICHFRSKIDGGRYRPSSLHYTIGNAYSALGKEEEAKTSYETALADPALIHMPDLAAQTLKNLGTSIERLGDQEMAVVQYLEALRLSPDLPEAHNALGNYYIRIGSYEMALEHFDRAVSPYGQLGLALAVSGWRTNIFFNLNDGRAAFREINTLLGQADSEPWIWPWCARQVGSFGCTTVDNARQAHRFWQLYVAAHPEDSAARREILLVAFYLRREGQEIGKTYVEFRDEFVIQIAQIEEEDVAFLWDRLGHWAQDENDWIEAERCFRKAFECEGGHYGYCLGTALNFLDRCEESLPILIEQAQVIQPDAMSWFQTAVAYEKLDKPEEAIDAYNKALALDPNYDLAMFNLGGVHWNRGDVLQAAEVWGDAAKRFPNHELTAKLTHEMPFVFSLGGNSGQQDQAPE